MQSYAVLRILAYGCTRVNWLIQIASADLVLDLATGQARRGKQIIPLTPIEFRLLSYLARHRDQALSWTQLVEAVWGFAPDLES